MTNLANQQCVPCQGGVPPMQPEEIEELITDLHDDWDAVNDHHLKRSFDLADFEEALALTNDIGEIAEAEGHHPNIELTWGEVTVTIYTHKIDGLHKADFVLAAKIDELVEKDY
ncbi:MAG: 4a-hydroxytetrahydrobiopterin dehydratase [Candidatus Nanohaloarchaeota archaeon QJJ-5]|nr:4a-hydroxytetrahydrobiopterin dehydratase [Candidatus Nanohaloarchaeota archaeon QJJ-5]